MQHELEECLIVVTSAHAKLKRDMRARVNIEQPDVSMSPLAMVSFKVICIHNDLLVKTMQVRSNENRVAIEPAV